MTTSTSCRQNNHSSKPYSIVWPANRMFRHRRLRLSEAATFSISNLSNTKIYFPVFEWRFIEKLVNQLVKKFTVFYGNRRFITVFTRARLCSLSWATWIQPAPLHLRLGLPSGLFP